MTKLKKYNTLSDWDTAKGGGDLEYPSVGMIEEDSSIVYMKKPVIPVHTLPIKAVFYDSSTDSFVKLYPDEITEANPNYTPIGVEVVPAEHDVYGTGQAGIMSLCEMDETHPDTGSSNRMTLRWGGYGVDASLPNYNVANYIGEDAILNDGVVQGTDSYVQLPSDNLSAVSGLDGKSGYYNTSNSDYQAPSPYNADGSRNEAYYTTAYSTANALSDFDGAGNTKALIDLATEQSNWKTANAITNRSDEGYYPAACCCWRFHTAGTKQGDWYLPAAGEIGYLMVFWTEMNNVLSKIAQEYGSDSASVVLDNAAIWTSSEFQAKNARYVHTSNGLGYSDKVTKYSVRAFIQI